MSRTQSSTQTSGTTSTVRSSSTSRSNANVTASKGLAPYQENVTVQSTSSRTGTGSSQPQTVINNVYQTNNYLVIEDHNVHRIHPRERDVFMYYDRPGSFFSHDPHYFGYRIHALPPRPKKMTFWGVTYYYHNNVYYRPWGSYYVVCRPPYGVYVEKRFKTSHLAAIRFAYYHNAYRAFNIIDNNYRTINEQNLIIARNNALIAQQNASMALNSNRALTSYELAARLGLVQSYASASAEYYYEDGVFFAINSKGRYEVIIPPAGALVSELPDDYDVIVLGGIEYYRVDDTVYRLTLVDGSPYLEVLGQLTGSLASQYTIYR